MLHYIVDQDTITDIELSFFYLTMQAYDLKGNLCNSLVDQFYSKETHLSLWALRRLIRRWRGGSRIHDRTLHTTTRRFCTLRETSSRLGLCDARISQFPMCTAWKQFERALTNSLTFTWHNSFHYYEWWSLKWCLLSNVNIFYVHSNGKRKCEITFKFKFVYCKQR
jgi:hypothetical protein